MHIYEHLNKNKKRISNFAYSRAKLIVYVERKYLHVDYSAYIDM